ncbi:MAG: glycosyltransferase [Pseudomonadota bacterium]
MSMPSISGFMVLRNAAETGYPFIESIVSALAICDEFLISDGFSSDDTWACLNELKSCYPDRITLFQDSWPAWRDYGRVMATVSNLVRARCRGDFCLYVQSNEVMHESSREEIRRWPLQYPDVELFRIPYCNYLGPDDQMVFDFRRRLFANKPRIALVGDAYDAGYLKGQLLKTPRRFVPYLLHREGEKACYLRDPYHRYWGIAPRGYLTKLRQRSAEYDNEALAPAWRDELDVAERAIEEISEDGGCQNAFWRPLADLQRSIRYAGKVPGSQNLGPHPQLVEPLLGQWRYDPWASLERLSEH